ncbi:MAG: extracellular solute-binding protein [Alphaproteobacteria bacterium]|nr:extracellular solute-binding protein [Alphaproteobacteria bacterium]
MKLKSLITATVTACLVTAGSLSASADDVELVHDKGFWSEALQKVGDSAGEKTGNKIIESAYSAPEQYKAFIQSSVASGDMPDMFTWWTGGIFAELVETGAIAELDGIWEELIASGDFDPSVRDFYKVGDHIYGVPLHLSRWIALYNKKQFEEAGISEPKTWDELMAAADKLKAAGFTPFHATTQDGWRGFIWFQEIMLRTDPEAYKGLHDGTVAYDSDAVRNAFKIWSDWYAKGYFSDPRSNEEAADFARGKGAIYLIGDWAIGLVEAAGMKADEEFGAFIMPNQDPALPSSVIIEGGPIVLSKAALDKPDVVNALKYFVSVDGANAWAAASGNALGNKNATPPNSVVAKVNADVDANGTLAFDRWWEAVPADIQGEAVAEFNRFMLDPTMETAESVMSNIQALNAEYWANR